MFMNPLCTITIIGILYLKVQLSASGMNVKYFVYRYATPWTSPEGVKGYEKMHCKLISEIL